MGAGRKFRELLEVLLGHEVDFLVVGATAAVLGGAPLTTFDLDVVIESKVATGREKDHAALPLLREVLRQRGGA